MATLPVTAAGVGAGAGAQAWLLSSMSVGLAAGLLAVGVLGDNSGRRRVYVAGLAALACGASLVGAAGVAVAGRSSRSPSCATNGA